MSDADQQNTDVASDGEQGDLDPFASFSFAEPEQATVQSDRIEMRRPDDWHLHLRDGDMLSAVVGHSARHFARAIIMPNLVPPIRTTVEAQAYKSRIKAVTPEEADFDPLMTIYLTEETNPDDLSRGFLAGDIAAAKLYPAGATTNSESGVRDMSAIDPVLERMADVGMPLLVHGEVTDPEVDIFDREAVFLERVLMPMRERHPGLKIVMEHITTKTAVDYATSSGGSIAATITAHHLIMNRNAMFKGGIRPHYFCLPVAKREEHRQALVTAATSGDPRFFLGTDSAPHTARTKEAPCGCAGVFSAPVALQCVTQVFENQNALGALEAFVSLNGPLFYARPPNESRCTLIRHEDPVELYKRVLVGFEEVVVFDPEMPIHWSMMVEEVPEFDFELDLNELVGAD